MMSERVEIEQLCRHRLDLTDVQCYIDTVVFSVRTDVQCYIDTVLFSVNTGVQCCIDTVLLSVCCYLALMGFDEL